MKAILTTILYLVGSYCVYAQELGPKDPGPQALKAHIGELRKFFKPETVPDLHKMIVSFIPEKTALESALADYIPINDINNLMVRYDSFRSIEEGAIRKMVEKETQNRVGEEIIVIPATVDEMAVYKKDSDVYNYFTKGDCRLAQDGSLNPLIKYYKVLVRSKNENNIFTMDLVFWYRGSVTHDVKPGWRSLFTLSQWLPPQDSIYPPPNDSSSDVKDAYVKALKSRLTENEKYLKKLKDITNNFVESTGKLDESVKIKQRAYRASLLAKRDHCEAFSKDLNTRINVEEMAMKLAGYKLLEDADFESIKKNVEIKEQIEMLETELKNLRLAKEAKLKIILSPGQLSQENIENLKAEVDEINSFYGNKEAKILQLRMQLK